MENIDIKDFSSVSAVNDTDNILLARSGGSHGKMLVSLFKQAVIEGLSPNIRDGIWYVGDKNLNVQAEGKTPVLEIGTVTTLEPTQQATASVEADGETSDGKPKYKINLGLPKGNPGDGDGNVYVETAGLVSGKQYVFQPSSDGSATGQFVEVETSKIVDISSYITEDLTSTDVDKLKKYIKEGYTLIYNEDIAYAYINQGYVYLNFIYFVENDFYNDSYIINSNGARNNIIYHMPYNENVGSKGRLIGYSKASSYDPISEYDTINKAISKLEYKLDENTHSAGGNVNVTNGSSLQSANYYAFKPSANGSTEGTFTTIPNASSTANGLMSSADKSKLDDMKQVWKVPSAVLGLTDESTSDEIVEAFGMTISNFHVRIASCVDNLQAEYKAYNSMKAFIGNYECLLSGHVTDGQYTIDFNYVDAGTLKTISIIQVPGGPITFACKLSEAGGSADDTYWLSNDVYKLKAGATKEEIDTAIGDANKLFEAVQNGKKVYIKGIMGFSYVSIPVSVSILNNVSMISFPYVFNLVEYKCEKIISINADSGWVKVIYPEGYELKPEVYNLTSSSTSDDISAAVGGESGMKAIIQAVKDGNRLVIRGTDDSISGIEINQDLMCNLYKESENGDISLVISGIGYGLFGGVAGFLTIYYTKSSNTFSCIYTPIAG